MSRARRSALARASSGDLDKRLADLQKSIDILLQTAERLEGVPPEEVAQLGLDDRKARAHAMSDAFLAIEDLENAKPQVLNANFESRRPELHQATDRLAKDLSELQDTVAFIAASAAAVGVVADVVSLIG
jgi:hypothetical protein